VQQSAAYTANDHSLSGTSGHAARGAARLCPAVGARGLSAITSRCSHCARVCSADDAAAIATGVRAGPGRVDERDRTNGTVIAVVTMDARTGSRSKAVRALKKCDAPSTRNGLPGLL